MPKILLLYYCADRENIIEQNMSIADFHTSAVEGEQVEQEHCRLEIHNLTAMMPQTVTCLRHARLGARLYDSKEDKLVSLLAW